MPTNVLVTALEKKLDDAQFSRDKKRKNIFRYAVLAIFMLLLVGVFIYLIVQLDFTRIQLGVLETLRSQQSPNSQPLRADVDSIASTQIDLPQTTLANNSANISDVDAAVFRQQVIQQLAQYESDIEPKINELQLNNWATEKYVELQQLKERAVEDFAKGEYLLARAGLKQAHTMVAELSAEYVQRLLALRHEANTAFANNRIAEVEKAIQQALRMSPADAEMRALQQRVVVLPQVLDLLTQADVAGHENRPEKEIVALQKVLALDRSRNLIKSRLEKLQAQLKQQQFASALGKAQRALDTGNLTSATKQITVAKTLFPANTELAYLQNKLQRVQIENEFAKQTFLAEQAKRSDDWQVAVEHFRHARKLKPSNKTVIENHHVAQQVVDISQHISRRLIAEHRLADETIANNTATYLREVEPLVKLSKRLQKAHAELARKVDLYNTKVDVVVISDNKTYIIVRGQGQVGKILRRTIRLRPGKRVFEGTRSGYKSRLVTVDIKPGGTAVEVTIVCDEKI